MPDPDCSGDVSVALGGSAQLVPALLAAAIVLGVCVGAAAAALLYLCALKPALLRRKFQGYDTKRLFETDDLDKEDNQSDCVSVVKKQGHNHVQRERERKLPLNSDVAAFALKAKVVYPINQRYRPLADGASNPSLHENCKMVILPNQMPEGSSLSSLESLSQENEDDSSQFISSSPIPKAFQNEKFIKIKRFPETLSSSSFDSRISLYWLGLQSFEHVSTDLHEVKNVVLRILLNEWSRNEIVDDAFYSSVLAMQERELKKPTLKLSNSERLEEPNSPYCTLEEIERNEKDKLEYGIQMRMNFNKQVEGLCQHLQSKPTLPHDLVGEMTKKLIENLVLVENLLTESQSSDMMNVQEKLVWWECISATLESKPLLLKQEAVCRLKFTAKVLEQLTSDGKLTFQEMEKILSDLQKMFQDEIQQYTDECNRQTKDLVNDMIRKFDTRRKNLHKIQAKERRHFQDSVQQAVDPMEFVKAYHDLLVKQKKEGSDLEDQQDVRIAEAVCELWKRLHSSSSQKMVNTVQELFLGALPSQTQLPQDKCELLRQEANRDLSLRLQTEEANAKHHLELFKDHLERQKQIWREEEALTKSILKHLTEQQQKLFQGTIVRQRDLLDGTGKLTHMKHSLLLQAINRQFSARQFSLGALKEMRLSRVKSLVNETRQERTKSLDMEDWNKTPVNQLKSHVKESSLSEVERRLTQDSQMIGVEFQQEFLSELSGATELLQEHAAMVIGRALAQKARQQAAKANREGNESIKHHLKESATESVYVTRESVSKLIENHYTHIQSITQAFEQDQHHRLQNIGDAKDKLQSQKKLNKSLQKELANWCRKPTSFEFYQRVESQKKKMLSQYDLDMEATYELLRQKSSILDHLEKNLEGQLQEAEDTFMTCLSALARVPLRGADSSSQDLHLDDDKPLTMKSSSVQGDPSACTRYEQGHLEFFEDQKKRKKKKENLDPSVPQEKYLKISM